MTWLSGSDVLRGAARTRSSWSAREVSSGWPRWRRALARPPVRADSSTSVTYTTTGEHVFVVPAGVTSIHVVAIGASGQPGSGPSLLAGPGGDGAMVSADLTVAPGTTVYAEVDAGRRRRRPGR